mmetsp:Transcript_38090/g.119893  ORF Transcript_38090/g.119893 Transcript_38090/m.119893 type:complete len:216 (+) Transcript_38090:1207-1854(+)
MTSGSPSSLWRRRIPWSRARPLAGGRFPSSSSQNKRGCASTTSTLEPTNFSGRWPPSAPRKTSRENVRGSSGRLRTCCTTTTPRCSLGAPCAPRERTTRIPAVRAIRPPALGAIRAAPLWLLTPTRTSPKPRSRPGASASRTQSPSRVQLTGKSFPGPPPAARWCHPLSKCGGASPSSTLPASSSQLHATSRYPATRRTPSSRSSTRTKSRAVHC